MGSSGAPPHIAIFPLMAKGHTVPLIHLAHLLHRRGLATFTFFTTPLNAPFLRHSLAAIDASIVELPFPENVDGLPPGAESTDRLPSLDYLGPFINAVGLLRPHFDRALQSLPSVSFLISDGFMMWTAESAAKMGIPRIVFFGFGNFSWTIQNALAGDHSLFAGLDAPEQSVAVPGLDVRLGRHDLCPPLDGPNPQGQFYDFIIETCESTRRSHGVIVNSFYELDGVYFDHWNAHIGPKAWCVGPLCLFKGKPLERSALFDWLDSKQAANRPVLYIAFGTQATVSELQLREIAIGLELSGLDFLWVVRTAKGVDLGDGFESRVAERGRVVREWVDQYEILQHPSVKGFVSHCGWNSTLESVCAGVPILAWPMNAEQPLNAKFLVDELRIGVRVRASDGTRDGLVRGEDLARMVKELVVGERAKEADERVKVLAEAAVKAVGDGGSSWRMLEEMIEEVSRKK